MSTILGERRENRLRIRYERLNTALAAISVPAVAEVLSPAVDDIQQDLAVARARWESFAGSDGQDEQMYERYMRMLDRAEQGLEDIEFVLSYVRLHEYHTDQFSDQVATTVEVCDQVSEVFDVDAVFLPIIQEEYALLPLVRNDVHAVFLPHDPETGYAGPLIAHEVAHVVVDEIDRPPAFDDRVQQLWEPMSPGNAQDFLFNWHQWFDELFCDACGFFTFGPAYLHAILSYLYRSRPYIIQHNVTGNEDLHPPDYLRYELLKHLAYRHLSAPFALTNSPVIDAFETHGELLQSQKPREYDDWTDQELLDHVEETALFALEVTDSTVFTAQGDNPKKEHLSESQKAANNYWLNQ